MKLERIQLRKTRKPRGNAGSASFTQERPRLGRALRFLLAVWDFLTRWRSDETDRNAKPPNR